MHLPPPRAQSAFQTSGGDASVQEPPGFQVKAALAPQQMLLWV